MPVEVDEINKTTYILTAVLGLTALALVFAQGRMGGYGDASPWGGPGYGMGMGMGGYGMGGMMGGVYLPDARPLAEDEAKARLQSFVDRFAPGRRSATSWPSRRTTTPRSWTIRAAA